MTHIRGRHTFKAGASATFRSREILNADNIIGTFVFNQNHDLELRAASRALPPRSGDRLRRGQLPPRLREQSRAARLIGEEPYTEKRPEWAAYVQDDFRVDLQAHPQPRPALGRVRSLGRGGRSAVELRPFHGPVRGRLRRRRDRRGRGGPLPADLLEDGLRTSARLRLRRHGERPDDPPWRASASSGTGASEGPRPPRPRTLPSCAPRLSPRASGPTSSSRAACPLCPQSTRAVPPAGSTRSAFDVDARDSLRLELEPQRPAPARPGLPGRGRLRGLERRQLVLKTDQNQAPPDRRASRIPTSTGPTPSVSPLLRTVGTVLTAGTLDYHALLVKVQKRFANGFSFLNAYTYGKAIDLASDNDGLVTLTNVFDPGYNRGPADYDVTHTLSSSWHLRAAVWPDEPARGLAGERDRLLAHGPARHHHPDRDHASTGVATIGPIGSETGAAADPTIDQWFDPAAFQQTARPHGHLRHMRGGASCAGPGSSTSTCRSSRSRGSAARARAAGRGFQPASTTRSSPSPTVSSEAPASERSPRCSRIPPARRAGPRSGRSSSGRGSPSRGRSGAPPAG